MSDLILCDTLAAGNGSGLGVSGNKRFDHFSPTYGHLNSILQDTTTCSTPSLTNILGAIEVIDRVPGGWCRDGAIALYSTVSGVDRRHVERIRGIQSAIAGGAA